MKKLLFTLVLSFLACVSFAQIKSVDAKIDYRAGVFGPKGDAGAGLGVTIELSEKIDFAPRFNWYMVSDGTRFTAEADLHYNLTEISDDFYLYPLLGAGVYHYNWKDTESHNHNKVLINAGCGIGYPLSEYFTVFGEAKYQIIAGEDSDTYFSAGISYCF